MSAFKKIIGAISLIVVALGAAGCSSAPSAKEWAEEVAKAGFADPVVIKDDDRGTIIMASAGSCRLRFIGDKEPVRLFVTLPGEPLGEEGSFLSDPSLSLIKGDERFTGCFSEEKQS